MKIFVNKNVFRAYFTKGTFNCIFLKYSNECYDCTSCPFLLYIDDMLYLCVVHCEIIEILSMLYVLKIPINVTEMLLLFMSLNVC